MKKIHQKLLILFTSSVFALFPSSYYWSKSGSIKLTLGAYLIFVSMFIGINIATYLLYFHDKQQAESGRWRIAEKTLHTFALFGGWPAAFYAIKNIRHKSSKRSFQIVLYLTAIGNIVSMSYIFCFSNFLE